MSSLKIFTDGGSRGNPGPAACGFVVMRGDKEIAEGGRYLGDTTNNVAEYSAVLLAIDWLNSNQEDHKKATFFVDSELLVKQVVGEYKVKNPRLRNLYNLVKEKIKVLNLDIKFVHVKREKNQRADSIVNKVLDENTR